MQRRNSGRGNVDPRPLSLSYDDFGHADCSVILSVGNTKVHVAVSLQDSVPHFLRGKGRGWLTAEYAMMPTATKTRTTREAMTGKRNGRNVEIARIIGRSLRSVIALDVFGEKTIVIDCDVLQADGGTRTACISAASLALSKANERWIEQGRVPCTLMSEPIGALSAGIVDGQLLVDLDQEEDMAADADFNFVMTKSGAIIEMQGTAEQQPVAWGDCVALKEAVQNALQPFFDL